LTFDGSTGIVGSVTEDNVQHLGEWLRERREELDISLDQAEEDTRIRVRYLEALETEDFESLPDPAVGRGFLRNYAAYLHLDPKIAIERFSELVAPPEPEPVPGDEPSPFDSGPFRPVPLHGIPGRGSGRGLAVALLVVMVAALAVLGWWAYPRIRELWQSGDVLAFLPRATEVEPTDSVALPIATHTATLEPSSTNTPSPVVSSEATASVAPTDTTVPTLTYTPSPSPTPSPPVYTGIFLELVLTDTSWIQVSVDGVRQFQGNLEAEAYQSWYGENRIVLRGGNAGAVVVTLNGQNLGPLGKPGEVVDRVYEKVGDQVGQLTVTPGPTWTPTPNQPPPTATPTPSPPPAPAATEPSP
jgi:cytoskeletal protein RodZ